MKSLFEQFIDMYSDISSDDHEQKDKYLDKKREIELLIEEKQIKREKLKKENDKKLKKEKERKSFLLKIGMGFVSLLIVYDVLKNKKDINKS